MTSTVNEAADIITGTYGALTITYRRLTYTWTVTAYNGTLRIDELCATYDNAHAAWSEARRIALAAHEGKTVWQIEAEKPSELALAEVKAMIDGIAANMQAVTPTPVDVSDIMADADPNWRAKIRNEVRRDYSKTRISTQPPTPAELDRIRQHRNGVVTCAPGQSWTLLRAIVRRELGTPVYEAGTRKIQAVRLNARGWAVANDQNKEIAA